MAASIAKSRSFRFYPPSCKMLPSTFTAPSTQNIPEGVTDSFLSDPEVEQEPSEDPREIENLSNFNWISAFAEIPILSLETRHTPTATCTGAGVSNCSQVEIASGSHRNFSRSPGHFGPGTAASEKHEAGVPIRQHSPLDSCDRGAL